MKSKQDILNAFRETFVTNDNFVFPYSVKVFENWLLTILTEFERETREIIKLCAKEQSCSMCKEYYENTK